MEQFESSGNQDHLAFNEGNLIIIDPIQDILENKVYYSDYVLILICTSGKIQMEYDGNPITVHNGELFLGIPGSVLSNYMKSPDFDGKLLAIKTTELTSFSDQHSKLFISGLFVKNNPVATIENDDREALFDYYKLICSRVRQKRHHYYNGEVSTLLNAFLLKVISIVDKGYVCKESATTVNNIQIVERFIRMVNDDCGCNRSVNYYADKLHITPKYLSALVRHTINRAPSEIIKTVTMKEIERRLRYTNDSIKEISNSMNFPNQSFFGKYFKGHSGMSPNNYRNQYHQ